jgi:virginiamycin B lyase
MATIGSPIHNPGRCGLIEREASMHARYAVSLLTTVLLGPAFPAQAQDLPDGPGKPIVAAHCGGCHDINRVRAGYTPEGWRTVIRMMQNIDVPVPKDQWDTVTDYLIKNFPEKPRPAAAVIDGPQQIRLRVWAVPTPGSRPRSDG